MLWFARGTTGASPPSFRWPKSAVPIVNPWRVSVSWCWWSLVKLPKYTYSKIFKNDGFKQPSNLTWYTTTLGFEQHTIWQIMMNLSQLSDAWGSRFELKRWTLQPSLLHRMHSLLRSWQNCMFLKEPQNTLQTSRTAFWLCQTIKMASSPMS